MAEIDKQFLEANARAFASVTKALDEHDVRIEGLERQVKATLPLLEKLLKTLESDKS